MIDAFSQIKQRFIKAYEAIHELRIEAEKKTASIQRRDRALALKIIQRLDELDKTPDQAVKSDFLIELLDQLGVQRIPPPIDQTLEYGRIVKRVRKEGVTPGTVLHQEGGAYVRGEELIRPAGLVVAE